jgi:hypothetical protein
MGQVVQHTFAQAPLRFKYVKPRAQRLVRTEYSGRHGDRTSRSTTLEGAMRAALLRIAHGEYTTARVYDERHSLFDVVALHIGLRRNGIAITWRRTPKWEFRKL